MPVEPTHKFWLPLNVPADAGAVIVTVLVAVAGAHPPEPAIVYVMTEVPDVTPVTKPVVAFTVATAVLLLLHVPPVTVDV